MITIIAGGRNYVFNVTDIEFLDEMKDEITEVVSGHATGADKCGEEWAHDNDIPCTIFDADWKTHGTRAGPIRNRKMAEYADAVVLFPGGKGTENMYNEAKKKQLTIYDRRYE